MSRLPDGRIHGVSPLGGNHRCEGQVLLRNSAGQMLLGDSAGQMLLGNSARQMLLESAADQVWRQCSRQRSKLLLEGTPNSCYRVTSISGITVSSIMSTWVWGNGCCHPELRLALVHHLEGVSDVPSSLRPLVNVWQDCLGIHVSDLFVDRRTDDWRLLIGRG